MSQQTRHQSGRPSAASLSTPAARLPPSARLRAPPPIVPPWRVPIIQAKAAPPKAAKTVAPPPLRWPGGRMGKGGAAGSLHAAPVQTLQQQKAPPLQPRRPPPPSPRRPAVIQRVRAQPGLAALRTALGGQVSRVPGACLAQAGRVRGILEAYVDDAAAELGAALLEWILEGGEDAGNHIACRVTWTEGEFVVDTTWKQFDAAAAGEDIFIGSVADWQALILSKQNNPTHPRLQRLARAPSDSAMALSLGTYQFEHRPVAVVVPVAPVGAARPAPAGCCVIL